MCEYLHRERACCGKLVLNKIDRDSYNKVVDHRFMYVRFFLFLYLEKKGEEILDFSRKTLTKFLV